MKTLTVQNTQPHRAAALKAGATLVLAAGLWALSVAATEAQARDDVYWSIGVNSPGVTLGVSNARPPRVVVQQAPQVVYHQPPAVVYHQPPAVVYHQPPAVVYHQPPAVVYRAPPQVIYAQPGYGYVRPAVVLPPQVVVQGWGHGSRWDDRRGPRRDDRGDGYRGGRHWDDSRRGYGRH